MSGEGRGFTASPTTKSGENWRKLETVVANNFSPRDTWHSLIGSRRSVLAHEDPRFRGGGVQAIQETGRGDGGWGMGDGGWGMGMGMGEGLESSLASLKIVR